MTLRNASAKIAASCALAAVIGLLGISSQFYREALIDAFFALALASVLILHFRVRPDWFDAVIVSTIGALLGFIDFRILHYVPRVMAWFAFFGLASFLVMSVRTVWALRDERKRLLYAWIPAALFVLSDYFASDMLEWTSRLHPKTLDLYLLVFDGSLRVQLAFVAGRLYRGHEWLHVSSVLAYVGLAIPIAVVYAGRLVRFGRGAFAAMLAFLITGPVGIVFYNIFPACGPIHLFGYRFPMNPMPIVDLPRLILEPIAINGPRNAIPSLHMAWTLLAWWYSRGLSWMERSIALAFLVLTTFATLGTGEHWFVDLVVAFPFALMIQGLCAYSLPWSHGARLSAVLVGGLTTLAWLGTLRFGTKMFWTSPVVPWVLLAGTVAIVCTRQTKLCGAMDAKTSGREAEPVQAEYETPIPA